MLEFEALCLSTQFVISLRLKLKWGLNALLPAHLGLGALVFEYSIPDFFEAQTVRGFCWFFCAFGFLVGVCVWFWLVLFLRKFV